MTVIKNISYFNILENIACYMLKFITTLYQISDDQSQLQAERRKETAFISTGFNNWKKALEKFKKHQNSLCHKASLTYEEVVPQCGNVREMTDKNLKAERE